LYRDDNRWELKWRLDIHIFFEDLQTAMFLVEYDFHVYTTAITQYTSVIFHNPANIIFWQFCKLFSNLMYDMLLGAIWLFNLFVVGLVEIYKWIVLIIFIILAF
jgi:hypothetical protein